MMLGAEFSYLCHPKFGRAPDAVSMQKIVTSLNYKNGQFSNLQSIPDLTRKRFALKAKLDFLFRKYPNTMPIMPIPTMKVELMTIEKSENIVIWLGYSAYYIQINGLRFLIDPIFSEYASPFPFMIRAFLGTNIFKSEDFSEINYLIITHDHWEHLDYATIKALKPKIKHVITALGVEGHLRHWGIDNLRITEMDWNDEIFVPSGKIISISARHFSGRCFIGTSRRCGAHFWWILVDAKYTLMEILDMENIIKHVAISLAT